MGSAAHAGDWHLGVGDPTVLAWIVTAGYIFCALFSVRAALASTGKAGPTPHPAKPWWSLAAVAAVLGVNKQLDLQTLLIELARGATRTAGLYEVRRGVQKVFVVLIIAVVAVVAWRWVRVQRVFLARHRTLVAGVALIGLYTLLRMAAINHIELGSSEEDVPRGLLLVELLGVTLWSYGAANVGELADLT
jgi:hypothetical protein